jgi:hypothetical protein
MFCAYKEITKKMSPVKKTRFDRKLKINIGLEENDDNYFDNQHWEQRGALLVNGRNTPGLHGTDIVLNVRGQQLNLEYKRNKCFDEKRKNPYFFQIDIPVSHCDTSQRYEPGQLIMHSLIDPNTNIVLCDVIYKIKNNIEKKRRLHYSRLKQMKYGLGQKYKICQTELEPVCVIYFNELFCLKFTDGCRMLEKIKKIYQSYKKQKIKLSSTQIQNILSKHL